MRTGEADLQKEGFIGLSVFDYAQSHIADKGIVVEFFLKRPGETADGILIIREIFNKILSVGLFNSRPIKELVKLVLKTSALVVKSHSVAAAVLVLNNVSLMESARRIIWIGVHFTDVYAMITRVREPLYP